MSMRCEDVRPLLAELVYEEVDAAVAEELRDHLGTCLSCRRRQRAFMAVRKDLQQWPEADAAPQGVTFITSDSRGRSLEPRPIWHNRTFQGVAAAAGFMFVAALTAAAVNLQVQSGADGWAVSTSFGQSPGFQEQEPATVSLEQIPGLDRWFNTQLDAQLGTRLQERGVVTLASMPRQQFFTGGQVEELDRRVTAALDETLAERDQRMNARIETTAAALQVYVDTSVEDASERYFSIAANVVEGIEAEHRDRMFQVTRQFSELYANTDRKLEEANLRINGLLSLVPTTRSPEQ